MSTLHCMFVSTFLTALIMVASFSLTALMCASYDDVNDAIAARTPDSYEALDIEQIHTTILYHTIPYHTIPFP